MSNTFTTAEASAEFERLRANALAMQERMAAIPHSATLGMSPADAAQVKPIIEAAIAEAFNKFSDDLAAVEKQLIPPTESE